MPPTTPWDPLCFSLTLWTSLPLAPLLSSPSGARRRCSSPSRPPPFRRHPGATHELRLVPLFLLTELPDAGSPWTPQAPSFPSSATEDRRRRLAASRSTHCELLLPNPLSPLSISSSSPLTTTAEAHRRRGWSRCSSKPSTPSRSTRLQEPVASTSFFPRAP